MSDYYGQMQPPTEQAYEFDVSSNQRSSWPTVLGVLAIVFGAFGSLCGLTSGVSVIFAKTFLGQLAQMGGGQNAAVFEAQIRVMEDHKAMGAMIAVAATFLAIYLLIVGIGLVRRKTWSVGGARLWSILKIAYAVAAGISQYVMSMAIAKELQPIDAQQAQATEMMALIQVPLYSLWYAALPIFFLIWFARGKIRQDVRAWSGVVASQMHTHSP